MTTREIDELVAGLAGRYCDEVGRPSTPGAQALLTAITSEETEAREEPDTAPRRRRRGRARLAAGAAAATVAATLTVVALDAGGPRPIGSYANAAVAIRHTGGTYQVRVKNVYADQRRFHEAFARFGLDVTLSIVPVAPGRERKIIAIGQEGGPGGTSVVGTVLRCPPGQGTRCPLTVELSGKAIHDGATEIFIGRAARPGEPYRFQHPVRGDDPPSLRLAGRTVAEARARLRRRNMTAVYVIGRVRKDGSGDYYAPPRTWRPRGGRRVIGAWMHSSDSVALLVTPGKSDPGPDPAAGEVG